MLKAQEEENVLYERTREKETHTERKIVQNTTVGRLWVLKMYESKEVVQEKEREKENERKIEGEFAYVEFQSCSYVL